MPTPPDPTERNPPDQVGSAVETVSRQQRRYWRTYGAPTMVARLIDVDVAGGDIDRREFLVTAEPAPHVEQLAALARQGWAVAADGRWPTLRRSGTTVRWLGAWTSGRLMEPGAAEALWRMVETTAAGVAPGGRPIGAPGTTGRDLWLRLIPAGAEFPCVSDETGRALRATSGQGRMEVLRAPAGEQVRRLVEYDARLAYLGALSELPLGEPVRMDGPEAERWQGANPYGRARYHVTWSAPAGWNRPGILSEFGEWPTTGQGWADGSEVALAQAFGWRVRFEPGAFVWERTCSPFRAWSDRLVRVMAAPPRGADAAIWRAVWRSVALHTIGAMHGADRKITRFGPADQAPDDGSARHIGAGVARWVQTAPALWPETHHPEWTSTIWSRARARLLDAPAGRGVRVGALHVAPGEVVAFRTDAVYLRSPAEWPDDGGVGRFRLKSDVTLPDPVRWPASQAELLRIVGS